MVLHRSIPLSLAFLTLIGAGTALAAPIQFTGNVEQDFQATNQDVRVTPVASDPYNIGQVDWITKNGWISGWSIKDIRTSYDSATDSLSVGINTFKNSQGQTSIFGQANGDPTGAPTPYDPAHLGGDKSVAIAFAPNNSDTPSVPGIPVVIAGIPSNKSQAGTGIDGFTVSQFKIDPAQPNLGLAQRFGAALPDHTGAVAFDPSPSHPGFEFTIKNFSKIPGIDPTKGFWLSAYAGSAQDGVAGEVSLDWTRVPSFSEQNIPEPTTWLAWSLLAGGAVWRARSRRQAKS